LLLLSSSHIAVDQVLPSTASRLCAFSLRTFGL